MSDSQRHRTIHKNAKEALEENLTTIRHEDAELHYIGLSLPVATDEELQPVGINTTAGNSPLAARADHVHGIKTPYNVAGTSAFLSIPNGGTRYYVNNWSNFGITGSEDWIGGSAQTIDFPYTGLYLLNFYAHIRHDSGSGAIGAGLIKHGVRFTIPGPITVDYVFGNDYVDTAQTDYYRDVSHGHYVTALANQAEYWVENNLPVNVEINLQFVGYYLSGAS